MLLELLVSRYDRGANDSVDSGYREFLLLIGNFSRGHRWERFGRGVLVEAWPLGYEEFTKVLRCPSRAVIAFARMGLFVLHVQLREGVRVLLQFAHVLHMYIYGFNHHRRS
jgi:hypothetical protein